MLSRIVQNMRPLEGAELDETAIEVFQLIVDPPVESLLRIVSILPESKSHRVEQIAEVAGIDLVGWRSDGLLLLFIIPLSPPS